MYQTNSRRLPRQKNADEHTDIDNCMIACRVSAAPLKLSSSRRKSSPCIPSPSPCCLGHRRCQTNDNPSFAPKTQTCSDHHASPCPATPGTQQTANQPLCYGHASIGLLFCGLSKRAEVDPACRSASCLIAAPTDAPSTHARRLTE